VALAAPDWNQGIEDAWSRVATFVPKLAAFLLILVVGYVAVKALSKAVDTVLERTGFDRAVERGGIRRALATSQYDPSDIVSKLVFYTLLLFVLQMAFGVFGPNPVSDMLNGVVAFLPKAFVAIVIVVVASAVAAAVKDIVGNALGGLSYGRFLANAASVAILFFGVVAALQQVEVATLVTDRVLTAVLFALAGIAIVAVGGGGIQPMRAQWEKAFGKVEQEAPRIREQVQASAQGGAAEPYPAEPYAETAETSRMPAVETSSRRLPTGGASTRPRT
jgi:hypothetical protein